MTADQTETDDPGQTQDSKTHDRAGALPLPAEVAAEITRLAALQRRAGGTMLKAINGIGGSAEAYLDKLPSGARARIESVIAGALETVMDQASASRRRFPDQPAWRERAVTVGLGAAGGMGGLPFTLAELPATTLMLMRQIQAVAVEQGFDPAEENVRFDCLQVFASAGPLEHDDGSDTAFLAARLTVNGATLSALISRVAPKLAAALGPKLAAQAVPVLGAAAGATINNAYARYYREMAEVHFGLRRLAIEADVPDTQLLEVFRAEATRRPIRHG